MNFQGKLIVENCPPMLCTGLDCAVVTERNGCEVHYVIFTVHQFILLN